MSYRQRQPSVLLKPGECFPDLLEFRSYLEKIEYVGQIQNNQALSTLIVNDIVQILGGKYIQKVCP